MAFLVKYLQDIPKNCSECPCSVHIKTNEVYCNARQKHFVVSETRPEECGMMECNEETESKKCDDCIYCEMNDHWGFKMCYNDNDCQNWNLWEAK